MASAFFNKLAQERGVNARAISAGTMPGERVHPEVASAMEEMGIDLADAKPTLLTNDMVQAANRIVTMGCAVDADACPTIFIKGVTDWGLPDPKGQGIEKVRAIRDKIAARVEGLLDEMVEGVKRET
jgi:arsenate reductase